MPVRRRGGDVADPQLGAGRGVEGDHAVGAVHAEHPAVGHRHAVGPDAEAVGLASPSGRSRSPGRRRRCDRCRPARRRCRRRSAARSTGRPRPRPPGHGQLVRRCRRRSVESVVAAAVVVVAAGQHPVTTGGWRAPPARPAGRVDVVAADCSPPLLEQAAAVSTIATASAARLRDVPMSSPVATDDGRLRRRRCRAHPCGCG